MRQDCKTSRTCLPVRRARQRRRHCRWCGELFEPDPRTKGRQRYCSKPACQIKRQRLNEAAWRAKNPECLKDQRERSRLWYEKHPDYSRARRAKYPHILIKNRGQTKTRMRKIRLQEAFDKSKVILTKLVDRHMDKCCLTQDSRWLMMRLTKASVLSKLPFIGDNRSRLKREVNRLPRSDLYNLSGIL